jgi:hypothetical protein
MKMICAYLNNHNNQRSEKNNPDVNIYRVLLYLPFEKSLFILIAAEWSKI